MPSPVAFAEDWCAAWNARDVERVLSYFHDDVVFTSPLAARLLPETGGIVVGKTALRDYWRRGLATHPDLAFTIEAVFAGVHAITIQYRNEAGRRIGEVLVFDGDRVRSGHAMPMAEE